MARGDGPDHDEADDGATIERDEQPHEAARPSPGRPARAAVGLGILVALLAGGLVGFVLGGGATSDDPDLQALCIMVGAVDDDALDRLEAGELSMDDPFRSRIGAIPPLARAASEADGAPEDLAEAATQVTQGATRLEFDELREGFETLRTYC